MTGSYASPSSSSCAYSKSSKFLRKSSQVSCGRRSVSPESPASLRRRSRTLLIVELSCSRLVRGAFVRRDVLGLLDEAPLASCSPPVVLLSTLNNEVCEG